MLKCLSGLPLIASALSVPAATTALEAGEATIAHVWCEYHQEHSDTDCCSDLRVPLHREFFILIEEERQFETTRPVKVNDLDQQTSIYDGHYRHVARSSTHLFRLTLVAFSTGQ